MTFEQFVATQARLGLMQDTAAQGFTTVQAGLGIVDGSVKQMSAAIVQMEVIRILNEAEDPVDRTRRFATEIDERFAKAVENVYIIHGQYDKLSEDIRGEYQRKIRAIGEHIYSVYEDDFCACAEVPMMRPPDESLDVALLVEDAVLRARSEALDKNLEALGQDTLEPLLEAHQALEHDLAWRFAFECPSMPEQVAIPVAVAVVHGTDGREVLGCACACASRAPNAGGPGIHYELVCGDAADATLRVLGEQSKALAKSLKSRKLRPEEIATLEQSLARLAEAGLVDPELLPGYHDYLELFGLETTTG
jgi:Txe/YoeB family toxin of Txe-Axe toxin-antitoxin module